MDEIGVGKEPTETNIADLFTKLLGRGKRKDTLQCVFLKGSRVGAMSDSACVESSPTIESSKSTDLGTSCGLSLLWEHGITEVPPTNLNRGTWEFGMDMTRANPPLLLHSQLSR